MFLFLGVMPIKVEESNLSVVDFEELQVDQKNEATPRLGQPNCYLPTHDRVCTYGISDILKNTITRRMPPKVAEIAP